MVLTFIGVKNKEIAGSPILGGQAFGRKEEAIPCGTIMKRDNLITQIKI